MAQGGKHLAPKKHKLRIKSSGGKAAPKRRVSSARRQKDVLRALVFLLFCFAMTSPLQGCIVGDGDYIGHVAAQQVAIEDAGIPAEKAQDMRSDMIKIDGEVYYKVQFTGSVTDYRYIIDAETGEILTQVFYRLDKTD